MKNHILKFWDKFNDLGDKKGIFEIKYKNEVEQYVLLHFFRITAISDEILILAKNEKYTSTEILMRSVLESCADLICLINDSNHLDAIKQDQREQEKKYYENFSTTNPYYCNLTKLTAEKKLKEVMKGYDKKLYLSIESKFKKARIEDLYRTLYNRLCRFTHGNISALAEKNFHKGKIVQSKQASELELLFNLFSTVNMVIVCTINLLEYFLCADQEIELFKALLEENKTIEKKFMEKLNIVPFKNELKK